MSKATELTKEIYQTGYKKRNQVLKENILMKNYAGSLEEIISQLNLI